MMGRVSLVAHRGQPLSYPENSLQGFSHVIETGVKYVETDVQITADGIPILNHDAHLLKLTGKQLIIADHDFQTIKEIPAGYAERFGERYNDYRLASLQQFVELIQQSPDVECFIEIKAACLDNFGMKAVDLVYEQIKGIIDQAILISFEYDALLHARKLDNKLRLGWVLSRWSEESRLNAIKLNPEFLHVDQKICPNDQSQIWPGNWQWVAYTINQPSEVAHFASLSIELLETDRYSELITETDLIEVSHDF